MDEKIQAVMANSKTTGPVQLGLEFAKALRFTEMEFATSTVTGCKMNGQHLHSLDPSRMILIDRLVCQKFSIEGKAKYAAVCSVYAI